MNPHGFAEEKNGQQSGEHRRGETERHHLVNWLQGERDEIGQQRHRVECRAQQVHPDASGIKRLQPVAQEQRRQEYQPEDLAEEGELERMHAEGQMMHHPVHGRDRGGRDQHRGHAPQPFGDSRHAAAE